jgi:outer membrane protein OmpA-like peptidoglycan-associated protein
MIGVCAGALAFATSASAQQSQGLLYPDSTQAPQLRQPGDDGEVIHLHMPVKHRVVHHKPKPKPQIATAEPMPDYSTPAYAPPLPPVSAPAPKTAARPVRMAAPAPKKMAAQQPAPAAPRSNGNGIPFSLGYGSPTYTPPEQRQQQPQRNTQFASVAPPTTTPSVDNSLTRRSQIIFAAGAADPAANAIDAIRMLGSDLNATIQGGNGKVVLEAYGGAKGDKSSDARRLSLKRALAIRTILISAGVPSPKIDVMAKGGADAGPADRVDVYIKA